MLAAKALSLMFILFLSIISIKNVKAEHEWHVCFENRLTNEVRCFDGKGLGKENGIKDIQPPITGFDHMTIKGYIREGSLNIPFVITHVFLCEGKNFEEPCERSFGIGGSVNHVESVSSLFVAGKGYGDCEATEIRICFYKRAHGVNSSSGNTATCWTKYIGEAAIIVPWMGPFINDEASSVGIEPEVEGRLTVCQHANLQPPCKVIKKDQFDFFGKLGMNDTISSFKFECGS